MKVKHIGAQTLFNTINMHSRYALLDFRPREDFEAAFVRRAFNATLPPTADELAEFARFAATIGPRIDRLAIIALPTDKDFVEKFVAESDITNCFDNCFLYCESLSVFAERYQFFVLSTPKSLRGLTIAEANNAFLAAQSDRVLYANSSFPFEVENGIFVGLSIHRNCARIIGDLKIAAAFELRADAARHGNINQLNFGWQMFADFAQPIDFELLFNKQSDERRILFCGESLEVSVPLLIAFLVLRRGLTLAHSTLKAFGACGHDQPNRQLYSQLLCLSPS